MNSATLKQPVEPTKALRHPDFAKLHLFKAPNGKSANWYAGFHHKGTFVRRSTRTADWQEALAAAGKWYEDLRYGLRHGQASVRAGTKFKALVKPTLASMRSRQHSERYVTVTAAYLADEYYIGRFFGDLTVEKITTRTWDEFRIWLTAKRLEEGAAPHSEKTVHQMKNAVRLVLRQAYIQKLIEAVPSFEDPLKPKRKDNRPRVFFSEEEYRTLLAASRRNIKAHQAKGTRWVPDAKELHDYIIWMVNTGMRVGESRALRFKDVQVVSQQVAIQGAFKTRDVCRIVITSGKRGAHPACVSYIGAPAVFRRIVARRGIDNPATSTERVFERHHHEAFKRLLRDVGLYEDAYGRKRDFVSLRHTYICMRLANGVNPWDVARNTRTSVTMIENHYAKSVEAMSRKVNITA